MNQKRMKIGRQRSRSLRRPLRFSPSAWGKLLYLRDRGETEIGGFGLAETDDPLLVTEIALVDQICTEVSVKFVDPSVADFFDHQVDRGRQPAEFARIWIHTHPGQSPEPSWTDNRTFARVFGNADWSVMFILACGGRSYARLQFTTGPGGTLQIPVEVDFSQQFTASDEVAWEAEYLSKVRVDPMDWLNNEVSANGTMQSPQAAMPAVVAGLSSEAHSFDLVDDREECWYD